MQTFYHLNISPYERLLPYDLLQESPGEEVIADVSSTEEQFSVSSPALRRLWPDLAVLHHLHHPAHPAHHPHRLAGGRLGHHLTHTHTHTQSSIYIIWLSSVSAC